MRTYPELKHILELWEQGIAKEKIVELTGISRYEVRNCIASYGSVQKLDEVIGQQPDSVQQPSPREYNIGFRSRPHRKYNDEQIREAVAASNSMAEVLRRLNIVPAGGNYATLRHRIEELGLDTSHFTGKGWAKDKKSLYIQKRPVEDILVKDSTYMSTHHLKQRLITDGIFPHQCVSCGLRDWLDAPIPLEVDHINGDRRDNRLENLRLLCPNCHAQTATYRGKNKGMNT